MVEVREKSLAKLHRVLQEPPILQAEALSGKWFRYSMQPLTGSSRQWQQMVDVCQREGFGPQIKAIYTPDGTIAWSSEVSSHADLVKVARGGIGFIQIAKPSLRPEILNMAVFGYGDEEMMRIAASYLKQNIRAEKNMRLQLAFTPDWDWYANPVINPKWRVLYNDSLGSYADDQVISYDVFDR